MNPPTPQSIMRRRRHADRPSKSGDLGPGELALLLAYLSAVMFVAGLVLPSFTMVPKLGGGLLEDVAKLFVKEDLRPKTFSLAGGILHLLGDGELFLGSLILLFSILFPLTKLGAIFIFAHQAASSARPYLRILDHLGKWSMLDVFVVAAVVISFKGFPGGSQVRIERGLYVFAASIILSMLATWSLKKHFSSGE